MEINVNWRPTPLIPFHFYHLLFRSMPYYGYILCCHCTALSLSPDGSGRISTNLSDPNAHSWCYSKYINQPIEGDRTPTSILTMKFASTTLLTFVLASISALGSPAPETNPANTLQKRGVCAIATDGARCRRSASLTADIIGQFAIGRVCHLRCFFVPIFDSL